MESTTGTLKISVQFAAKISVNFANYYNQCNTIRLKTKKNSSEFNQDIKLTQTTKPEPVNLLSANSIIKEQRNIEKDSALNNSNEIMDIEIAKVSHNFYLPDLHIDIHVYSENTAERFVFVNMKKYGEGSFLDEGPLIKAITEEGVVLEQNDISFLLPNK